MSAVGGAAGLLPLALRVGAGVAVTAWVWDCARAGAAGQHADAAPDEQGLAATTWTVVAIGASALVLGAFGWLTLPAWLAAVAFAGLMLRRGVRAGRRAAPDPDPPSRAFAAGLAGLLAAHVLFVARNPHAGRDSLTYHLPMVAHWLATHAIGAPLAAPPETATYYPGNVEMLQLWLGWNAGSDVWLGLVNISALALLAWALRRLAIRQGAPAPIAEGLALVLVATPVCTGLVKTLSADLCMAAGVTVALVFLDRWRARGAGADLAVALVALGWTAGTRYTGPAYAAVLLVLAWWPPGGGVRRGAPVAAWAVALLLGGLWLVRNLVGAGNPVYPAEVRLPGLALPGLIPLELLRRTTVIAAWREGWAGQFTLALLWRHYFLALPLLAAGLGALGARPARRALHTAWRPMLFALFAGGLFLISFYSGVNMPSVHGEPPLLATDNVRYLLPAWSAMCSAVAVALGALVPAVPAGTLLGLLAAAQLAGFGWRLGAALGAAVAAWLALRLFARARLVTPVAAALAYAVLLAGAWALPPARAPLTREAWRGYAGTLRLLAPVLADSLRAEARGRVIAIVGLEGSYELTGADFSGRPAYVPVQRTWASSRSPWALRPDDRARADRGRWLENLGAARAAFVAIAWKPGEGAPVESLWCASEPARFAPRSLGERRLVYRVISGAR